METISTNITLSHLYTPKTQGWRKMAARGGAIGHESSKSRSCDERERHASQQETKYIRMMQFSGLLDIQSFYIL